MDICWDRMVVVIMGVGQYEDNDQDNDYRVVGLDEGSE